MIKGIRFLFLLWIMASFVTACSSSNTPTVTKAVPVSTSTASLSVATSYPAPTVAQMQPTAAPDKQSTGYPAPAQATPASPNTPQDAYPAQGGGLVITLKGVKQSLSIDILNSLPMVSVNLEGKDQAYRKLGDVLAKVGAANYARATITGQAGAVQLNMDQIGQAYLDIQADGKMRILVQGMPAQQWPVNVTAIAVE